MPDPSQYNYGAVGTQQFDVADPSVMGRVTQDESKADIDHVNIWMRSQPWYQDVLAKHGGNAGSDAAKKEIEQAAQQNGVQVDQSNIEIDDSGNFKTSGMATWEKVAIVAGIAAATIATMGAAGVFAAAGAPGAAGTIGTDAMLAGEAGLTTTGAGAASALAGLGATGGIGVEGLGAAGALASGAGAVGELAPLASTATGTGAVGGITAGSTGVAGEAIPTGTALGSTGSTLGTVGSKLAGKAGQSSISSLGNAISQASSAAGNTRRANVDTNVAGQSAFEQELMNRAKLEADQRKSAAADVYRYSADTNQQRGPAGIAPVTYSPNYLSTLSGLEQQGMNRLKTPAQYGTDVMPKLQPYVPTSPSTMETIGSYVGPAVSTIGTLAQLYGKYA